MNCGAAVRFHFEFALMLAVTNWVGVTAGWGLIWLLGAT